MASEEGGWGGELTQSCSGPWKGGSLGVCLVPRALVCVSWGWPGPQRRRGKLRYEQGSEREKLFSLRPASKQNGVRAPVNGRAASHLRIQVGEQRHDDLPFTSWLALQWGWRGGVPTSVLVGVEGVGHGLLQLPWCTSSFPGKKGAWRGPVLRDGCLLWPDKAPLHL